MTKRNNPRPTNYQEGTGREISITDGIVCAQNKKELSFEDTAITFRQIGGTWRISLRQLAEYYDVPFKQASRKLTSNSDLFRDLVTGAVTAPVKGTVIDYELSIRDAVSFLTLLDYRRYDDDRKEKLIRLRNWLTDTAEKALTGKGYISNLDELEKIQGDYGDHSFLTGMVTHIVRKQRKKDPLCGCPSEQEIYQEDYNDIKGPGKLVSNWRKGLTRPQGKDLAVKKFFQGSNFLAGHVNKEDNRRRVIADIEEYCPNHRPEFMPALKQLDPTVQTKLIEAGGVA